MPTYRLPLGSALLFISIIAFGQTRGGGGGSRSTGNYVNPATNARNAAVLGTGENLDVLIVHPNSVNDEPKVEFRTQTVLIQVPVVVTDKLGAHVHGLNKEDFLLLENGNPVSLANFEELTASSAPIAAPASAIISTPTTARQDGENSR